MRFVLLHVWVLNSYAENSLLTRLFLVKFYNAGRDLEGLCRGLIEYSLEFVREL
jgi:hypothetical protein